jgi:hypothetical protein
MVNAIRGLTRPFVTAVLVLALVGFVGVRMLGYAQSDVPEMFSGIVGVVIGYWFASRTADKVMEGQE